MIRIVFIQILLSTLVSWSNTVYSQQSKLDSLSIRYNGALLLCDTANKQLPDTIRLRIIEYFVQNGFNPKEFYTTKFSFQNRKTRDEGFVGLLKIGALRDLYNRRYLKEIGVGSSGGVGDEIVVARVGSAGGEGDEIVVVFDNSFTNIKRISPGE